MQVIIASFTPICHCIASSSGTVQVTNKGETEEYSLRLEDVLQFATGATAEPPIGFVPSPKLAFQSDSPLPSANTCVNAIFLPLQHVGYEEFKYYFVYGIVNAAGFGQI